MTIASEVCILLILGYTEVTKVASVNCGLNNSKI